MKKIISFVLCVIVISIFSCDKIDGPTRETISIDTTCTFDADNSIPDKKVLVEDYTGHNCGNCPEGGVILNDSMRDKYGDKLVVVTVHAGDYANICPGLTTCPPGAPIGSFAADFKSTVDREMTGTIHSVCFSILPEWLTELIIQLLITSSQRKAGTWRRRRV
ncbi:hypothetical protein BH11BAC1_BH11BAC1_13890 [soil metagenome]